jgi:hypothetical protein
MGNHLRVFGVTAFSVLAVGAITAFVFIVLVDVGLAWMTSSKLFLGIVLWAAVAPLPVTLPLAVLCGLVAAWTKRSRPRD